MVAAEGAAAGALPLVARHSGLAEVAAALEDAAAAPGLFSFEPGTDAVASITTGIRRLLDLAPVRRARSRRGGARPRRRRNGRGSAPPTRYVEAFEE